jgi:DNA transposition AAA+ family ATPase
VSTPPTKSSTTLSAPASRRTGTFIATKEHRRFVEFADAVRRESYIGLCFGPAGVGKTLSARRYTSWDKAEPLLERWGPHDESHDPVYAALARSRAILYTPTTPNTVRQLDRDLDQLLVRVERCIDDHVHRDHVGMRPGRRTHYVDLLVVDEADRLAPQSLEHLRDRFDRRPLGLLLIGMPGIDKRLSRYAQLYSRIGFAHQYRPLGDDELAFVLSRHWRKLALTLDLTDFTHAQAVAAVSRITRGNFRLIHRLFAQIERVMKINDLTVITSDVVETARSTLVIGDI